MRTSVQSFGWLLGVTAVIAIACVGGPEILSDYGSNYGLRGHGTREMRHTGVDFAGGFGAPVLAAAGGRVLRAGAVHPQCGIGVRIRHAFGLNTVYCHLATVTVKPGAWVTRGQPIGTIGMSGNASTITHVHFMLVATEDLDPNPYFAGCYEAGIAYPTEKLVLTYPVVCANR